MPRAADRFDVIIVGGGMAGSTLALALDKGGLRVALIDAAPLALRIAPNFDGRASAISGAGFRQWRSLGADQKIEPHAQRIDEILVTDGRSPGAASREPFGAFLHFHHSEGNGSGDPLGYMVENRHIRAGLAAALRKSAVQVFAPEEAKGLEVSKREARLGLTAGRVLAAPLVVGADGRNSSIRRFAGIPAAGRTYRQVGIVATLELERDHKGVAHEYFLPSGPFAILPLTGRRASLVWTAPPLAGEALLAASEETFESHLRRRFGRFLGDITASGPRFIYPLSLHVAERLASERVALLGDAAHVVHPIAGQGLNMGLKDAAALAEVTVGAVRLGEDIGSIAVLGRYERWRRLDNLGVALATDLFARLYSNDLGPVRAGRDLAMAMVNRIGPARRFFMREAAGTAGDLPRLLRGEAL
ncbi:MAG: UbiH/UbiF/VisC/COQ6 family ubiquinone biosynthesis hydroxylase [Caulobacteraceae bacterium]